MTDTPHTTPDNAAGTGPPENTLPPELPAPIAAPEQASEPVALNSFKPVIEAVLDEHPEWRAAALERTPDGFDFWAGSEAKAAFRSFVMDNGLRYIQPQGERPSIFAPPHRDAA